MQKLICTPPFCDRMPKGNKKPSSKGGGDEELRNRENLLANHESHQERLPKSILEPPER